MMQAATRTQPPIAAAAQPTTGNVRGAFRTVRRNSDTAITHRQCSHARARMRRTPSHHVAVARPEAPRQRNEPQRPKMHTFITPGRDFEGRSAATTTAATRGIQI